MCRLCPLAKVPKKKGRVISSGVFVFIALEVGSNEGEKTAFDVQCLSKKG